VPVQRQSYVPNSESGSWSRNATPPFRDDVAHLHQISKCRCQLAGISDIRKLGLEVLWNGRAADDPSSYSK
jgi:hypothetical protein